jgi:predicted RND superfamily exporter protein
MSYEYASLLPKKDQAYKDYQKFVEVFGEEGNLIIVGVQDSNFFDIEHFAAWKQLSKDLMEVEGVENLLSISNTYNLRKNKAEKRFEVENAFPDSISSQEELDAFVTNFKRLPFYRGLVYNDQTNTYLLAITVNKDKMASKEREVMVAGIQKVCQSFEEEQALKLHYSGLPYIRVVNAVKI